MSQAAELPTRGTKSVSRSAKSVDKRSAIMRAATEIINQKSFALATMSEIAASLNMRDAALYYYFPTKQALVYACHVQSLERFERLLAEADTATMSGAERLEAFIRKMLDDSEQNGPQLYFGDHSYLAGDEREAIDGWAARLTVVLEQFLKDGIEDGSVVPCETRLVVQLLLGMIIWLGKWVPSVGGLTVDRLMAAIGAFSLHGLEKRASAENYSALRDAREPLS